MTKILRTVNIRHPKTLAVFTLNPGDDLPDWAVDLITNPKVIGDGTEPEPEPEPVEPVEEDAVEEAPADTGEDNSRAALEARAKELKIRFKNDATDAELELLISNKE